MQSKLRRRIATSPIARGAAFPLRTMMVARYDAHLIGRSVDWLVRDRETPNFTYDLNSLNRDQLCWFISAVTGAEIGQVRAWMRELEDDSKLTDHLTRRLSSNPRRRICAKEPHWARRSGWYAIVRAAQPDHVVETGTHLGLGSCVIAAALLRNGHGRLTTIDIDQEAGYLIGEPWASVIDRRTGSSVDLLGRCGTSTCSCTTACTPTTTRPGSSRPSSRTCAPMRSFFRTTRMTRLRCPTGQNEAVVITYSSRKQPLDHWWPGDGIGAAMGGRTTNGRRDEG